MLKGGLMQYKYSLKVKCKVLSFGAMSQKDSVRGKWKELGRPRRGA